MSSENAIEVSSVGKCYRIYDKPADRLKQMIWRKKTFFHEFWALKDISFSIKKGQTYGIIGRNGSGKSTLLQCICGTLEPTNGSIQTNGKIAALLELGAGFNPEFTGRENIYLACSLYALSKAEVDQRYNKIVEFADIGDHIEQPVKTYSSGMFVRLAFAVIAHVDADILIIDEALAVGDAVFTQKCMRFIRSFRKTGTLLFVSHDMASVLNLCDNAIWLHKGCIQMTGDAKSVSEAYLQYTLQETYGDDAELQGLDSIKSDSRVETPIANEDITDYSSNYLIQDNLSNSKGWQTGQGKIISITLHHLDGSNTLSFKGGERVTLTISAILSEDFAQPILGFLFKDRLGQDLFGENTLPLTEKNPIAAKKGETIEASFTFVLPMLPNGQYSVFASLANGTLYDNIQHHLMHDALIVNVQSSKIRWGLVGILFSEIKLERR